MNERILEVDGRTAKHTMLGNDAANDRRRMTEEYMASNATIVVLMWMKWENARIRCVPRESMKREKIGESDNLS